MAEQNQQNQEKIDVYLVPAYRNTTNEVDERKKSLTPGSTVRVVMTGTRLHGEREVFLAKKVTEDTQIFETDQYVITFPKSQQNNNNALEVAADLATKKKKKSGEDSSGQGTGTSHFLFGQVFFNQAANGTETGRYSIMQADADTLKKIQNRIAGLTVNQSLNHASGQGGIAQSVGNVTQNYAATVKNRFFSAIQKIIGADNTNNAAELISNEDLVKGVMESLSDAGVINSEEHVRCSIELIKRIFDTDSANKFLIELNNRSKCDISQLSQAVQLDSLTAALSDVQNEVRTGFAQILKVLESSKPKDVKPEIQEDKAVSNANLEIDDKQT